MMDYSKMSDFEINCAVAKAMGASTTESSVANERTVFFEIDDALMHKDFCNSWADAGPIIEKHNISLLCSTMRSQKVWEAMTPNGEEHCWAETNPLRAAMIAYLMMHDKGEE